MILEVPLPTLITVIITAAVDSINPCAIGVLVLMISVILGKGHSARRLLMLGGSYIVAVFIVYVLAGLGLTYAFTVIPLVVTALISIALAWLLAIVGIIEIKDFFWYGKGYSLGIPPGLAKHIPQLAQNTKLGGVFLLGAFVAVVELPCTGAPYLAIITILSQSFDTTAFLLLLIYNAIFILPLVIILLIVAAGKQRLEVIKTWKEHTRAKMRLAAGILLIGLAWLLILIANGTINFG